jgi:hypothetical protein
MRHTPIGLARLLAALCAGTWGLVAGLWGELWVWWRTR